MIQPADFTRYGMLNGTDVYILDNRDPGDHGGRYVEIEHVQDALVAFNDALELLRGIHRATTDASGLVVKAIGVVEKAIEKLK